MPSPFISLSLQSVFFPLEPNQQRSNNNYNNNSVWRQVIYSPDSSEAKSVSWNKAILNVFTFNPVEDSHAIWLWQVWSRISIYFVSPRTPLTESRIVNFVRLFEAKFSVLLSLFQIKCIDHDVQMITSQMNRRHFGLISTNTWKGLKQTAGQKKIKNLSTTTWVILKSY